MKIKDYQPIRPIILGDLGKPLAELPKLTDEQILAMQPESTKALLQMDPNKPFIIAENWKCEDIGERALTEEDRIKYVADRMVRQHTYFYKQDKTPVIRADNINGEYLAQTHEPWQKRLAQKQIENNLPVHMDPRFSKEKWVEMNWFQALIHWFKGGEITRE